MFLRVLEELRKAAATVVIDETLLPESFLALIYSINSRPYAREGLDNFLRDFGPVGYRSADEYQKAVGSPLPVWSRAGRRQVAASARERSGRRKDVLGSAEDGAGRV